ncbi:MAG: hypothetical protein WD492_07580 [Alkalispirochaeta sp.]
MNRLQWMPILGALVLLTGCETLDFALGAPGTDADGSPRESIVEVEDYGTVELEATTYRGDLIIDATSVWVLGQGADRTIIDGDLIIFGNRNEIRGIRVTGRVRISGNLNKIMQSDLSNTTIFDTGNDNEY